MILSSLILAPFIGALLLAVCPKRWLVPFASAYSILYFVSSLGLFLVFDHKISSFQLSEKVSWIPSLGSHYAVGIDGISFWLILLTTLLLPLCTLSSTHITKNTKSFFICLYVLTGTVIGSFLALDALLFYVFFEASLLPLFFLIIMWGGEERVYAAIKFFIYTALGSLFMLIGIASLIVLTKTQLGELSSSILDFYLLNLPFISDYALSTQSLLFFLFFIAFAIKTPLFPFHTWLPLAHVQAPTAGSVFLAAIVLKMGTYGLLRFILPLFPEASLFYSPFICMLAVVGIIYGALMALAQDDLKKLIAYSSVSHMGYVLLGLFVFNTYSITGSYFQMITHGLSSAGLFLLVGMIYDRTHTRSLKDYGGIASSMPKYSTLFFLVTFSAIALPLTGGFISEFLILFGTFIVNKKWAVLASLGVVLGAAYMLLLILKVFFGPSKMKDLKDLNIKEVCVVLPIVVLIFISGIFPNAILRYSKSSLDYLIKNRFNYSMNINTEKEK